jgi:hypothetical protein
MEEILKLIAPTIKKSVLTTLQVLLKLNWPLVKIQKYFKMPTLWNLTYSTLSLLLDEITPSHI